MRTKRLLLESVMTLIFLIVIVSCQSENFENLANDLESTDLPEIQKVDDVNIQNLNVLKSYINKENKAVRSGENQGVQFDSERIEELNIKGTYTNFYFVPQVNYSENNSENYSAMYILENGEFKIGMILKEEMEGDKKILTYSGLSYTPILKVIIDNANKTVSVENYYNLINRKLTRGEKHSASEFKDLGDCTAKCISAMYSDSSWSSVVLWCITAFCPKMTVGVAAWCAARCELIMKGVIKE